MDAIFVVRRSEWVGLRLTPWLFVGRFTHLSVLDFRVVVVRPAHDTIKQEHPHHQLTSQLTGQMTWVVSFIGWFRIRNDEFTV